MSPGSRLALIASAVAVLIGGFLVASSSDDDDSDKPTTTATTVNEFPPPPGTTTTATAPPPPAPAVPTIRVKDAKPVGGVAKLRFNKGDRVRFKVASDTADEIHVHGYDLMKDVTAGGTVSFSFDATIEGNFEIELEDHKEQIASLTVEP